MGDHEKLSTSALARRLEIPSQQLFSILKEHHWIRKLEDGWALTSKGEFEGGSYLNSKRYGRYIVWPAALVEHPLLRELESGRMLSAAAIGKSLGLNARQINRLLVVLGWLRASQRGWLLTERGRHEGGQAFDNQQSGLAYTLWPEDIAERPALARLLRRCLPETGLGNDLFSEAPPPRTLDGRSLDDWPRWHIAQWLYLAGLRYSIGWELPVEELSQADFYLPDHDVYLEYWEGEVHADQLSARMRRVELIKELGAQLIDVHPEDLAYLDEYLGRRLEELAVEFH